MRLHILKFLDELEGNVKKPFCFVLCDYITCSNLLFDVYVCVLAAKFGRQATAPTTVGGRSEYLCLPRTNKR
jgi:hypothetical protein